jgi:UDP-N-acetylglucosamine 2-epimerase (non-hydrolysing)
MEAILSAVAASGKTTIFPVHPRTRKYLQQYKLWDTLPPSLIVTEPLGYLDMIMLIAHAEKILTDSGGIQKEAYILGVPCITLRDTTEWVETLDGDWNVLAGAGREKIQKLIVAPPDVHLPQQNCFGQGDTAGKISAILNGNPTKSSYFSLTTRNNP